MADRNLVTYTEERTWDGPYFTLEIDRSSAGVPSLMFTIRHQEYDKTGKKPESKSLSVVVRDGDELLGPVVAWLDGVKPPVELTPDQTEVLTQAWWAERNSDRFFKSDIVKSTRYGMQRDSLIERAVDMGVPEGQARRFVFHQPVSETTEAGKPNKE
jgi:hypothetical protein